MDDIRLSNLLFLAGIASLSLPGCKSGEPTNDGGVNIPPGNPLEPDGGLTTAGSDTPGAVPEPGDGPGGSRGGGNAICSQFAARMVECGGDGYYELDVAEYVAYCEYALEYIARYFGSGCGEAYEELFACVAAQDCESFACSNQEEAVDVACGFDEGFGSSGGTGG